ncbi:MAG: CRISPR-associated endonuclease Cas2 [Fervidicoccaceae archaeon]|nr:MAG: CRISPR-associated endonuclease Cas2 [Fervidicoccus sp.]
MGFYIIVYDIGDQGKRQRVVEILEKWGLRRIQRSAFVGYVQEGRAKDIAREIEMTIDLERDVVHIVQIERKEWNRAIVVGTSKWSAGSPEGSVVLR